LLHDDVFWALLPKDVWACSKCTLMNVASEARCAACDALRPAKSHDSDALSTSSRNTTQSHFLGRMQQQVVGAVEAAGRGIGQGVTFVVDKWEAADMAATKCSARAQQSLEERTKLVCQVVSDKWGAADTAGTKYSEQFELFASNRVTYIVDTSRSASQALKEGAAEHMRQRVLEVKRVQRVLEEKTKAASHAAKEQSKHMQKGMEAVSQVAKVQSERVQKGVGAVSQAAKVQSERLHKGVEAVSQVAKAQSQRVQKGVEAVSQVAKAQPERLHKGVGLVRAKGADLGEPMMKGVQRLRVSRKSANSGGA